MKFNEYPYKRPDMKKLQIDFKKLINQFENARNFEGQNVIMTKINEIRNNFESLNAIVHIRHTINTLDEFYEKENDFMDEAGPIYEGMINQYYNSLVSSNYRKELEKKWGKQLFIVAELSLKTFSEDVLEDLTQENKLASQYTKLRASAKIEFDGEEKNLAQMVPYAESIDREIRKKAQIAVTKFFETHEKEFDNIYDGLVKLRDKIAKKLGYNDFVELGYARLLRSEYTEKDVAVFREQVVKEIVPYAIKLRERQAKRLGLDTLKYYDERFAFISGNAKPQGDADWIINNGMKMYKEMSNETHEFFQFMTENQLLDLVAKKGKAGGGYCTFINDYNAPFIFSNFNGTSGDVDVLTHEAGHAFQVYQSRNFDLPEYIWPTLEACEIHSMSMEFFAYPWMENFFKEEVDKYKFYHLSEGLLFISYGVLVDEFQHVVYKNPEMHPNERKAAWRNLEKKYLPTKDYEDNDFLSRGGYWFRQGHIFGSPFYYIDYCLAQVCAFQFWVKSVYDRENTWNDYLNLCKAGGSKGFLELVKLANLKNPFENGSITEVVRKISEYLENIDDTKM